MSLAWSVVAPDAGAVAHDAVSRRGRGLRDRRHSRPRDLLAEIHGGIRADAEARAKARRVVVYLGDYVSRARQGREVIDTLIAGPLPGFERVLLKGNHEDLILRFLEGDLAAGRDWLNTAASMRSPSTASMPAMLRLVPMPIWSSAGGHSARHFPRPMRCSCGRSRSDIVRATTSSHMPAFRPGVALAQQTERDLMWIRGRFLASEADFGATVVHGHSISAEPVVRHNRIGVDTGRGRQRRAYLPRARRRREARIPANEAAEAAPSDREGGHGATPWCMTRIRSGDSHWMSTDAPAFRRPASPCRTAAARREHPAALLLGGVARRAAACRGGAAGLHALYRALAEGGGEAPARCTTQP